MFTAAYHFSQVFCLILFILFLQILIVIVPQPLGLMQGHQKPEFFLSGRITTSETLSCYMLCFMCSILCHTFLYSHLFIMYSGIGISQDDFSLNYCDCAAHNS